MAIEAVVDTSILAKTFFDEPESDVVRAWIGGVSLFAPAHILTEIASVGLKKVRDGHAELAVARAANAGAPQVIDVLTPDAELISDALDIGLSARLSLYDGLFVALAARLNLPLITADRPVIERLRAAGSGVRCLAPEHLRP